MEYVLNFPVEWNRPLCHAAIHDSNFSCPATQALFHSESGSGENDGHSEAIDIKI